jgi:hypothetical protein
VFVAAFKPDAQQQVSNNDATSGNIIANRNQHKGKRLF